MTISNAEWLMYETQWRVDIAKHDYNCSYALNTMNQAWQSITEMQEEELEIVKEVIKFINIWEQLLIIVKNTEISKRWTAQERRDLENKVSRGA